ncbi:hypothetical protein [Halorubrum cibi]|uniref:Uncharacterized protein n=1 Tax=Halorubrum cibi TaxID=413815 RepID=A0A521EZQ7_9EURY|nr:hypothetical protein [Halorubrum cibi]SMO89343.1 hypothetical protein SAMN06264867_11412 [Halorubrum cibi]
MSFWFDVARFSAGLNVVLLLALVWVWGRNYLQFRSKHTLGLVMFGGFLLGENALALYIYLVDPMLSAWFASEAVPPVAWRAMMGLHVLQTVGLLFLVWVTWD